MGVGDEPWPRLRGLLDEMLVGLSGAMRYRPRDNAGVVAAPDNSVTTHNANWLHGRLKFDE